MRLLCLVLKASGWRWHTRLVCHAPEPYLFGDLVNVGAGLAAVPKLLGKVTEVNCSSSGSKFHNVLVSHDVQATAISNSL
jgi:hypothetical protein